MVLALVGVDNRGVGRYCESGREEREKEYICADIQTCVPYLCLDFFGVYFDAFGEEFYSDGGL